MSEISLLAGIEHAVCDQEIRYENRTTRQKGEVYRRSNIEEMNMTEQDTHIKQKTFTKL